MSAEIQQKILEAFESLPVREAERSGLKQRAFNLSMQAGFAKMNDLPRANKTRRTNGLKLELEALAEQAAVLHRLIQNLHGDTLRAMTKVGPNKPDPLMIANDLRDMIASAVAVLEQDAGQAATPGRPKSRAAEMIADLTLVHFEAATGRKAGRSTNHHRHGNPTGGEFIKFLGRIFEAFQMNASAPSHGRSALDRARAGIPPGGKGGATSVTIVRGMEKNPPSC